MKKINFVLIVLIGYFLLVCYAKTDYYKVLEVDKTATVQEIKRSYKKLARYFHPDKNKEPGAGEKFVLINEAYEILSNQEKRKEYDNFGFVDPLQQQRQQRYRHNFDPFASIFHGDGGFGGFGSRRGPGPYHITARSYKLNVLPESYTKPYIIYATADLCFGCLQTSPIWERFVKDLETVGIGIGSFNIEYDSQLSHALKIHHVPSIVGVIKGRVTYFQKNIEIPLLRDFVRGIFHRSVVTQVNDDNYEDFLSKWPDNRVRALLISNQDTIPLRALATGFKFTERIQLGYVRLGWNTDRLQKRFAVREKRETLLVFKEDQIPEASVSMDKLSRSTMDDILQNNRYLTLPRLSSQTVFNDICPPEISKNLRKLCVVLVTKNIPDHDEARISFRRASQEYSEKQRFLQFAYLFEEKQTNFLNALAQKRTVDFVSDNLEVVIIWRHGSKFLDYDWLEAGWNPDPDRVESSKKILHRTLEDLLNHNLKLSKTTAFHAELTDEHAQVLMVRIWNRIIDWKENAMSLVYVYFYGQNPITVIYALFTLLCVVFFGFYMHNLVLLEEKKIHGDRPRRKPEQKVEKQEEKTILIRELRDETFGRLIRNSPPGQMTICILVDNTRKEKLLNGYAKIIWPYAKYHSFAFAFLVLDNYLGWYRHLLEETMDFKRNLDRINIKNCIGTVLAINGHRKYFSMYHAKLDAIRRKRKKETRRGGFLGFEESDTESDEDGSIYFRDPELKLFEDDLLFGLSNWLDKLFEGSVKRLRVDYWPEISV